MSKPRKKAKRKLKTSIAPPFRLFNVGWLPSIITKNKIVAVETDNPLYKVWFNAWIHSIRGDYGFQKDSSVENVLSSYPYISEIELFVLARRNRLERGDSGHNIGVNLEQMLIKELSGVLRTAVEQFETKYLMGFAKVFKIAVNREESSAYFDQDHFKCFRSWVILSHESYFNGGGEGRLMSLSREEFSIVLKKWLPSTGEILDDLAKNEGNKLYTGTDRNKRSTRVKKILTELGLPYRKEK